MTSLEKNNITTPDFSGEEMKMPENSNVKAATPVTTEPPVNIKLLTVLTILLVAILGGVYYWFSHLAGVEPTLLPPESTKQTINTTPPENSTTVQPTEIEVTPPSGSDELSDIESDLNQTDIDGVGTDINNLDAEVEASTEI